MAGERGVPPAPRSDVGRAGRRTPQHRQDLCADDLDSGRIEARRGERQTQIVERLVPILHQRAQRAAQRVVLRLEAELDGLALEAIVKGAGVEIAGAFIEQRSDQGRGAGFAGRILSRAADEDEIDGDERDRRLAHQPGLDAAGAHHALDGRGASRRGENNKRRDGDGTAAQEGAAQDRRHGIHECFSSACRLLTR